MGRFPFSTLVGLLALLGLSEANLVSAQDYDVTVTRRGSNWYEVQGGKTFIETRYCYVYGYGRKALLRLDGRYSSKLHFLSDYSSNSCGVKAVWSPSEQSSGNYTVNVLQESTDLYSVLGTDVYIRTESCLIITDMEAILRLNASGTGRLHSSMGLMPCAVNGVFKKIWP